MAQPLELRKHFLLLFLLACGGGCGGDVGAPNYAQQLCDSAQLTTTNAVVGDTIREISGIAESRSQPNVYWVHSDSGNEAELFALSGEGELLNRYRLVTAENRDWEDITIAETPDGESYLYVGDIGDNRREREQITLYKLVEPVVSGDGSTVDVQDVTAMHFTYPDMNRNAESLFIDERDERFYIVTKETMRTDDGPVPDGPAAVMSGSINNAEGSVTALELETFIDFLSLPSTGHPNFEMQVPRPVPSAATAADLHPNWNVIGIRTNGSLWLWQIQGNQSVAEALDAPPCEAPTIVELGGEAVTFRGSELGYITIAEINPALATFAPPPDDGTITP